MIAGSVNGGAGGYFWLLPAVAGTGATFSLVAGLVAVAPESGDGLALRTFGTFGCMGVMGVGKSKAAAGTGGDLPPVEPVLTAAAVALVSSSGEWSGIPRSLPPVSIPGSTCPWSRDIAGMYLLVGGECVRAREDAGKRGEGNVRGCAMDVLGTVDGEKMRDRCGSGSDVCSAVKWNVDTLHPPFSTTGQELQRD